MRLVGRYGRRRPGRTAVLLTSILGLNDMPLLGYMCGKARDLSRWYLAAGGLVASICLNDGFSQVGIWLVPST